MSHKTLGKRNVVCKTGDVPLMNNMADICRECELPSKARELEQAGTRLSHRIKDVLDNIIDESALLDALEKWDIAKEEKQ